MNKALCPCGSNNTFEDCCGPYLSKTDKANTAEQLMRSRYTAFHLNQYQYLIDTHHPAKREINRLKESEATQTKISWVKLEIHNTVDGLAHHNSGEVEFSAIFYERGQFFKLLETSLFIKEKDQWMYIDGQPVINSIHFKLKRNEPCWCGSGLKYKACHLT